MTSLRVPRSAPAQQKALKVVRIPIEAEIEAELSNRPRSRAECEDGERPCPFAGCRFSLLLDVNPKTGTIAVARNDVEDALDILSDTCALDVAARGGLTLDEVADYLGVTREAVRIAEAGAVRKLRRSALREHEGDSGASHCGGAYEIMEWEGTI